MRVVSPLIFSIWQRSVSLALWVLLLGLTVGIGALLRCFIDISWLEFAVTGVAGGLGSLGYVAWAASNDWNGLVWKPRRAWQVSFDGLNLSVQSSHLKTNIPLKCIRSACVVSDGSWETLRGCGIG